MNLPSEVIEQSIHDQRMESDSEYREQCILDQVSALTQKGAEFDPFTHEHIMEALANLDHGNEFVLGAFIGAASELEDNEFAQAACAQTTLKVIREYWEKRARVDVEEHLP